MLNLARMLSLLVALFLFSFTMGVLPGQEPVIEGYSLWFGISFVVAILLVIFRAQGLQIPRKKIRNR